MTDPKPDIFHKLATQVVRRYQANARKSMLDVYEVDRCFTNLENDNLEFVFSNRADVVAILSNPEYALDLARIFVRSSLEFTYNNNQFIEMDTGEKERLLSIYSSYLDGMNTILINSRNYTDFEKEFSTLVKDHFKDLSHNISRFFDRENGWHVQENVILKQVVCSDYSPDFQLQLLGLDAIDLLQPVLDMGCGKNGTLVKHLRDRGIKAIGIDRLVSDEAGLREANWFDVDFKPESWGTIISHMAFSNHFLFHHRYIHGKPGQYARLYMKILRSLKPGGCFVYSPALPFIEQLLPSNQYSVSKQFIDNNTDGSNQKPEVVRVVNTGYQHVP
ncbi:MAG: class I SAM-dependent methyltransferase [Leptolinea sp.]|nr:class I SAM-dependent methyltransferase [Leptolinea sp.]